METSIIIRAKNEEKWIGKVLEKLMRQTYKDFEIIIVDSGSTDKTLEIIKRYLVRLFHLKPEEFTYPYALNFSCRNSNATKYFVILSGHSLPVSNTWLEDGLSNFDNDEVLGVYGTIRALTDGSVWEKLYFNFICNFLDFFTPRKVIKEKGKMGVMGFTNAIIRRDLWEKRNFNDDYSLGGEDGEWAGHWFNKGYIAVRDKKFCVYHSHGLGLVAFIKQWFYWASLNKPQPFKKLEFRK